MKAGERDGLSLHYRLENILFTYRLTPHATSQVPPGTLFLGRNIRTPLDLLHPDISRRVCEKQAQQKKDHDLQTLGRDFVEGQKK